MIQKFLSERLQAALPDLTWTHDTRVGDEEKGTVYYEGGGKPEQFDVPTRYPNYMIYISSADLPYAEYAAERVVDILKESEGADILVEFKRKGVVIGSKTVRLFHIEPQGEPLDLGVNDVKNRDFSVNIRATITEKKEEEQWH